MHITASVYINDDETDLHQDYDIWREKLAPHEPYSSIPTMGMKSLLLSTSAGNKRSEMQVKYHI